MEEGGGRGSPKEKFGKGAGGGGESERGRGRGGSNTRRVLACPLFGWSYTRVWMGRCWGSYQFQKFISCVSVHI